MYLSHIFTKTSKDALSDASSKNADLLVRAGYIAKTMAGVYSFLPLGLRVLRHIESIVREEMNAIGAQEILLSALSPKEYWETTGRWDPKVLDVLFHLPAAGDQEYGLNPTHEEIITPLMKQFIRSYRDLPFAAYQIQTKFRNELRAKSGLLRGREFLMKDMYSFHTDQEDLERFYAKAQHAYMQIFARLGFSNTTYLTYASGGSFSKYSHEYQILLENGEDIIYVSEEAEQQGKRIAINKEIYVPGETECPVTGGKKFREERASEAGNIFMLGTRFSKAFELLYTSSSGAMTEVIMGCYGIGISRLMGIMAEACSDEHGLRWPEAIAPALVLITPLAKHTDEDSYIKAKELYDILMTNNIDVLFDDRIEQSTGSRLADADLLGIPYRIVVSPKTLAQDKIEFKKRIDANAELKHASEVLSLLRSN
jgi:prolyl-tRNA synthetase